MSDRRYTVLVVEDEPRTRAHFAQVVEAMAELETLAIVGSCAEAREVLARQVPDLMLTDLGLPDGSGIDLIRELRAESESAEIVVVTMFGDERNVVRSIEMGASGYLLKGGVPQDIAASIRELLAGGSPISPAIARHLLRRFRAATATAGAPEPESPLTARETDVLRLSAKGFTFPEIARLLEVSPHTVTTHMRRVYRKLEVSSKGEAVYEALGRGILSLDS